MTSATLYFSDNGFTSSDGESQTEVCIENISPQERKKRLKISIQVFLFTLLILGSLLALDLNLLWRLPLFFMFVTSTTTFFQWRDKT